MYISKLLLIIGLWVIVLPYLGFPTFIKNILFIITGLALIYLSLVVRKSFKKETPIKRLFENFSENLDFRNKE